MADILAALFRFRQFVFEYGPFFLATWFGLAVTTGLIAVSQRPIVDLKAPSSRFLRYRPLRWLWHLLLLLLWRPDEKILAVPTANALFLFSLAATIPALVATSLIGINVVLLRVALAALLAPFLNWLTTSILSPNHGEQRPEVAMAPPSSILNGEALLSQPRGLRSLAQVTWKSFAGRANNALLPLLIGFALASAITVYVPVYTIRPWLGSGAWWAPYLAALLAIPFQLSGGAAVPLASALLVKGASLGTALSVMLVAPITASYVVRHFCQPVKVKAMATYLVAAWLIAGSLGVAVDGIQRLLGG